MRTYIQITAGRGPVECARVVTLVAKELLRAIPMAALADCEPHNQASDCYMSMTFAVDGTLPGEVKEEWQAFIHLAGSGPVTLAASIFQGTYNRPGII